MGIEGTSQQKRDLRTCLGAGLRTRNLGPSRLHVDLLDKIATILRGSHATKGFHMSLTRRSLLKATIAGLPAHYAARALGQVVPAAPIAELKRH